jgi:CRP-like cAMP-binding protein
MLSMQLRPEYFLRGDWIAKSADISRSIIFVAKGYVEVVVNGNVIKVKHPGSYFGDDTAICGHPHRESYRAATDVEVFVLPAIKLTETLAFFPEIRKRINTTHRESRV